MFPAFKGLTGGGGGLCGEVSPCTVKSAMEESGVHTVSYSVGPRRLLWGANAGFNSEDKLKIARWKLKRTCQLSIKTGAKARATSGGMESLC